MRLHLKTFGTSFYSHIPRNRELCFYYCSTFEFRIFGGILHTLYIISLSIKGNDFLHVPIGIGSCTLRSAAFIFIRSEIFNTLSSCTCHICLLVLVVYIPENSQKEGNFNVFVGQVSRCPKICQLEFWLSILWLKLSFLIWTITSKHCLFLWNTLYRFDEYGFLLMHILIGWNKVEENIYSNYEREDYEFMRGYYWLCQI